MALHTLEQTRSLQEVGDRQVLDGYIGRQQSESAVAFLFGSFAVTNARLVNTPPEVTDQGKVLTNPSHIFDVPHETSGGDRIIDRIAYLRREPADLHLGKSVCAPYRVLTAGNHVGLQPYEYAQTLAGEDLRYTADFPLPGHLGRVHRGHLLSTVYAKAEPDKPDQVASIQQDFYWGTDLNDLRIIHQIPGLKNTIVYPRRAYGNDTSVGFFGRPKPHITHGVAAGLEGITPEAIENAEVLTAGMIPEDAPVHYGVNSVHPVAGSTGMLLVNAHVAYCPETDGRKTLHYDLINFGYDGHRLRWMGRAATRGQFPAAEPKPPQNDVANFYDVLYGSTGPLPERVGTRTLMLTGLSDNRIAAADVVRTL